MARIFFEFDPVETNVDQNSTELSNLIVEFARNLSKYAVNNDVVIGVDDE